MNLRPHGPEPCALTELRYAPITPWPFRSLKDGRLRCSIALRIYLEEVYPIIHTTVPDPYGI